MNGGLYDVMVDGLRGYCNMAILHTIGATIHTYQYRYGQTKWYQWYGHTLVPLVHIHTYTMDTILVVLEYVPWYQMVQWSSSTMVPYQFWYHGT